jgi:anti-sigma B factor antagonist
MNGPSASMSVCLNGPTVCVKIHGRASFQTTEDFKALVNEMEEKGRDHLLLDLTDCVLMDSTFSGVLVSLAHGSRKPSVASRRNLSIELLNPNPRVIDGLENLGIADLFIMRQGPALKAEDFVAVTFPAAGGDRKELARTLLEAHQTLMDINPANVAKFTDVARMLQNDLKRMEDEDRGGKP